MHSLCTSLSIFIALGTVQWLYLILAMPVKTGYLLLAPTLHSLCILFTVFGAVKWLYLILAMPVKTGYLLALNLDSLSSNVFTVDTVEQLYSILAIPGRTVYFWHCTTASFNISYASQDWMTL